MYVSPNYRNKADINRAIKSGQAVRVFSANSWLEGPVPLNGTVNLEGPHTPALHSWWGVGTMKNGQLVAVR